MSTHNKKVLEKNDPRPDETPSCNCAGQCILPNECRTECVVYKASTVKTGKQIQYIGSTANEFKIRYRNHKSSFKNENKKNETALSQYIWKNKLNKNENDEIEQPEIKWQILKKCTTYKSGNLVCDLCTSEQIIILKNIRNPSNINHRSDLGNKCVHIKREMLSSVT